MKKIITIFSLLFVASSCAAPVNNNIVVTSPKPSQSNEVKSDPVSTVVASPIPSQNSEVKSDPVSTIVASPTPSQVNILKSGNFENARYKVSGLVKLVSTDNKKQLSFENFKTDSGPDLYIYLSEDMKGDAKTSKFIDLGRLTLNEGSFTVNIPNNLDPNNSKSVVVWCKAFGVSFGYATFK